MKKNYVLGIAALSAVVLLAGCGNKELTPTEYCEQNGGVSSEWACLFEDGTYCAEEAYANGECKAWEIIYNAVEEVVAEEEPVVEEPTVEEVNPEEVTAEEENVAEEEPAVEEPVAEEPTEEVVVEEAAE